MKDGGDLEIFRIWTLELNSRTRNFFYPFDGQLFKLPFFERQRSRTIFVTFLKVYAEFEIINLVEIIPIILQCKKMEFFDQIYFDQL